MADDPVDRLVGREAHDDRRRRRRRSRRWKRRSPERRRGARSGPRRGRRRPATARGSGGCRRRSRARSPRRRRPARRCRRSVIRSVLSPLSSKARLAALAIDWPIAPSLPLVGTITATRLRAVSIGTTGRRPDRSGRRQARPRRPVWQPASSERQRRAPRGGSCAALAAGWGKMPCRRSPMNQPLPPGLYIVATPIGNLGDLTARAAETLVPRRPHPRRGQARHRQIARPSRREGADDRLSRP